MSEKIAQRIAKDLGLSDLTEVLADKLSGSDLHSLLLSVIKRRVGKLDASKLNQPSPVTQSCSLDGRLLNGLEKIAYDTADGFDAVELSPLNPLGAVTVLTGLDQANVLGTVRAFECASDPTIGLAVECARRRKNPADRKNVTRVCTSQRVVRFPLPQTPGFTSHFKLFALVTAARDPGSFAFEIAALREHIGFYLSLLSKLAAEDFAFADIAVEVSDTRAVAHLCSMFNIDRDEIRATVRARDSNSSSKLLEKYAVTWPKTVTRPLEQLAEYKLPEYLLIQLNLLAQNVLASLRAAYSHVRFELNMHRLTGLGYYEGPCFHIKVKHEDGQTYTMADGGMVPWTEKLLCDSKERFMTSAIGTELLCRVFRRGSTTRAEQ